MGPRETGAGAGPEGVWKEAVVEFAAKNGLPVDDVLGGLPFDCNDSAFVLQLEPGIDPHGLVVMLDTGEIPAASEHLVHLRMLSHNARTPSLLTGYYGILPATSRGVYCVRLDARQSVHPAMLIESAVTSLAESFAIGVYELKGWIDEAAAFSVPAAPVQEAN
jgi:hypothetical protein